ncbi:hypothetical protein PILCRDRAFT_830035 [Piloderma croceum F 1598]|uniref:Uncharacterized protein n=1 Tax=Piloderma croceum (strain F 1598) TaxID=765440 RepID=A0A0C3EH40_PILCF|nr:hypothetical protein PILCRDRAFT_830035 [Piloderma croceum F 1598]
MANLIHSSKSGHDWTINDLMAYNISIVQQNTATFFSQAALPLPAQHPDLNRLTVDKMVDNNSYQVVRYTDLTMDPVPGEESAVDDFTMQLLHMMGYASRALGRDLCSRKDIPLFIYGEVMAGIMMTGTSPTFLKILVTLELIKAIQRGEYPATLTIVAMHHPNVPRPVRRHSEGMCPVDNRHCILSCFEAFRQFVN